MTQVAGLVAPKVVWHDEYGYALAEQQLSAAIDAGARCAVFDGGPLAETSALIERARRRATRPFFAVADIAGGVGEKFPGGTALPPLASYATGDLDSIRRGARLAAREARSAGISCAMSPSCIIPHSAPPIVRSRTFAGDDTTAAAACAEWFDACQAEGIVSMPGPYPNMRASAAEAALDAGVGGMALAPASVTDAELVSYLRNDAQFDGIIAAPLAAAAELFDADEHVLALACLGAGCDLLLGCEEPGDVIRALHHAVSRGELNAEAIHASSARLDSRAAWAAGLGGRDVTLDDALWARRVADGAVHAQRGARHRLASPVELIVIDDDPRRPEPVGTALHDMLAKLHIDAQRVSAPSPESRGAILIVLAGDRRIALGFDTFSDGALAQVRDVCARAARSARDVTVVHFTPPDFISALDGAPNVVCAWSGTRAMEEAAARWLVRGGAPTA